MFLRKKIFATVFLFLLFINCSSVMAYTNESVVIDAKNAIVMDIETGEVLYEKKSNEKVQIASTTKILTALLLAENREKTDLIRVTRNAMAQPSSSIYKDVAVKLTTNDYLSADNVMKGLLMASGNDMAVMIAEDIANNQTSFSDMMDKKALEIGMKNSDFYTPSGLDTNDVLNGENHYSTAFDMALLGIEAYNNSWVKENMGIKRATIRTNEGYNFTIENTNKNLNKNGCIGGKTGYTTKAKRCLVAFYERDNRVLVGVVLGGQTSSYFNDMEKIINFAFSLEPSLINKENDIIDKTSFLYKKYDFVSSMLNRDFPMVLKDNIYIYDNEFNRKNIEYNIHKDNFSIWNINDDHKVGFLEVKEPNRINQYTLYLDSESIEYISSCKSKVMLCAYVIAIGLISIIIFKFIKKR